MAVGIRKIARSKKNGESSVNTITHMCLNVRGFLSNNRFPDAYRGMFKHDDGRSMTPDEARNTLYDELAKGHEVIPLGSVCDGFDYSGGGCPSHSEDSGVAKKMEVT